MNVAFAVRRQAELFLVVETSGAVSHDHILNQNHLGLEIPLAEAFTALGFTEATI